MYGFRLEIVSKFLPCKKQIGKLRSQSEKLMDVFK